MCEWGNYVQVEAIIKISEFDYVMEFVQVDECIAPIVQALSNANIPTIACCCGHGKHHGSIILGDGREMLVMPDYASARAVDRLVEVVRLDMPAITELNDKVSRETLRSDNDG